MNKSAKREVVENKIATIEGNSFQDLCDRLLLKLYPDDYTPVRAGGPKGDLKNDGYCPKARIFFAAHATRGEIISSTKKKIKTDFEGCLKNHPKIKTWVYLTNDTLVGEVEAYIDGLRSEHGNINIETWGYKKIAEKILALDDATMTEIIGMDIISAIDIDSEIEDAKSFMKVGKTAEAINLLERLWRKYEDIMTARQKYRTQANIGHAYNQMERYDEAARYWLRAVQYEPDYEEAQARQAWAYLYQGNTVKAREIAESILERYPETTLARAIWILTFPDEILVDDIANNIPDHQKDDADILMALAQVASTQKAYDKAEQYLAKALRVTEDDPVIKEKLGRLLLQKIELWKYDLIEKQPTPDEKYLIEKAIGYIVSACSEWKKQKKIPQLVQAKLALTSAYRVIGSNDEANNNIRVAYELDNSNKDAATKYAALLANAGEIDGAIDLLKPLCDKPSKLATIDLYAQLLINRNSQNDKENALELLKNHVGELEETIPVFCFDYHYCPVISRITTTG